MFALSNLIVLAVRLLEALVNIVCILIFLRAVISWVNPDPFNPVVQFLNRATDPILAPIRRFIPQIGPVDVSPWIATIVLYYVNKYFLVPTLLELAMRLRS